MAATTLQSSRETEERILVECKRFDQGRRVGVGIARQLLGVQLLEGTRRAVLVTSSEFTSGVRSLANRLVELQSEYALELIDGQRLVEALGVFNVALPPLHLNEEIRRHVGITE